MKTVAMTNLKPDFPVKRFTISTAKALVPTAVKISTGIKSPRGLPEKRYSWNSPKATARINTGHEYRINAHPVAFRKKNSNPIIVKIPPGTSVPAYLRVIK